VSVSSFYILNTWRFLKYVLENNFGTDAVREVREDAGGLVSDILLSPFGLLTIYTGG